MAKLAAASGDDGTNDLLVSDVIRRNELQVWFLSQRRRGPALTMLVDYVRVYHRGL